MELSEIASTNVITVETHDSIDKAIALMKEHAVRHLPVLDNDVPVGIVSDRDVMLSVGWLSAGERISSEEGLAVVGPKHIAEIMSTPVRTLSPDDPVERGGNLMLAHRISACPLVVEGHLTGIVTETDFLKCYLNNRRIAPRGNWRLQRVADHMRAEVLSLRPKDTLSLVTKLMREKQIRHVPIVENGRVVGIVSDHDVRKELGFQAVDSNSGGRTWLSPGLGLHLSEIMKTDVESIVPSASLAEAADRMVRYKIGALPVSKNEELVGITTETDLLRVLVTACK